MKPSHARLPSLASSKNLNPSQSAGPLDNKIATLKIQPIFPKKVVLKCDIAQGISKYKLKGLSTLDIICPRQEMVSSNTIYHVSKCIKDNKRSFYLRIIGGQSNFLSSEKINQISRILNVIAHLNMLSIDFGYNYNFGDIDTKDLKTIFESLKRWKNLSNFQVFLGRSDASNQKAVAYLFKNLKGLKKIKDINVFLDEWRGFVDRLPIKVKEPNAPIFSFSYPRSLESLHLSFMQSNLPEPQMLENFASNLSNCQSLKSLDLDCNQLFSAENIFAPIFQKCQTLKTLHINTQFWDFLPIKKSKDFLKNLKDLQHLTTLDLEISFNLPQKLSKQFLQNFFRDLASITNLESLSLKLESYNYPSEDSAYENILLLRNLTRLQTLSLSLDGDTENPHRSAVPLHLFFQAFGYFSALRSLTMDLYCRKVSNQDIGALAQMFKNLRCIERLTLSLNEQYLDFTYLDILYQNLAHLKLVSFSFELGISCLDYFYLRDLREGAEITGVNLLFATLANFTSLTTLVLNFSVFEFSNHELENLSATLKGLKQLTNLSLEFKNHSHIKSLVSAIKEMPKLTALQLAFNGKMIDESLLLLASSLENLSHSLEDFSLRLTNAQISKNQALAALGKGLETFRSLRHLTIDLEKLPASQKEAAFRMLESLKFLRNLESIEFETPFEMEEGDCDGVLNNMDRHWNLKTFKINNAWFV